MFEAPQHVGLIERAAKIALKYGLTYDAKWREFRGDREKAKKATSILQEWQARESLKQRSAERAW